MPFQHGYVSHIPWPRTLTPRVTLLDALREHLGLTGTKRGCAYMPSRLVYGFVLALALTSSVSAGQVPYAATVPDVPVSHRDRVYTADQFSNTVSVIDPADNKLLGVIRLGTPPISTGCCGISRFGR